MAELQKTFSSAKFNWLDCVANDHTLKPAAFKVAYAIMQHVNSESMVAWLSDETLVDVTGISRAEVQRHRKSLRESGWLTWERTGKSNRFTPIFDRMQAGLDDILAKRAKRKELRETRRAWPTVQPDASPARQRDASPARQRDASPARHIHLRSNTADLTQTIPSLRSGGTSAEEADAPRAFKPDDDPDRNETRATPAKLPRDHQPKAPYLQSYEASERARAELAELPFAIDWCGGLPDDCAGYVGLNDRSERGVEFHWKRLLREGWQADDVVAVAERFLSATPKARRPSLGGFLARFENCVQAAAPPLDRLTGPRPQHHAHP